MKKRSNRPSPGRPSCEPWRNWPRLQSSGRPKQLDFDPAAVRAEFWKGNAAMAISWPTADDEALTPGPSPKKGEGGIPLAGFAELPGATRGLPAFQQRPGNRAATMPASTFRCSASPAAWAWSTPESEHAEAAFKLLLWLADPQWGSQVFAASPATTLFRRSQVASAKAWVESSVSATAARQYAEQTVETLSRRQFLASLRVPGRADYLAALDEAVQAAVRGKQKPAEALKAAAGRWREINKRLGIERQKAAYMHSLGLQ